MDLGGEIAPIGGRPDSPESEEQSTVECNRISDLNPRWEVCEETQDQCGGVFTDGAGCQAFCAAAGLVCKARYNGSPGCGLDGRRPIPCLAHNGHRSDWCAMAAGRQSESEALSLKAQKNHVMTKPPLRSIENLVPRDSSTLRVCQGLAPMTRPKRPKTSTSSRSFSFASSSEPLAQHGRHVSKCASNELRCFGKGALHRRKLVKHINTVVSSSIIRWMPPIYTSIRFRRVTIFFI